MEVNFTGDPFDLHDDQEDMLFMDLHMLTAIRSTENEPLWDAVREAQRVAGPERKGAATHFLVIQY
jgi:hypothetical protein